MEQQAIQEIIELTTEAIENGYSYTIVIDTMRGQYGVSDFDLVRIYELMKNHVWEEDNQYERFSEGIYRILDPEDIDTIQSEMVKDQLDHIHRTAPWILGRGE